MTNDQARDEVAVKWGAYGFCAYDSNQKPENRYEVGMFPSPDCTGYTTSKGSSWEEAFDAWEPIEYKVPASWFYSLQAQVWRTVLRDMLVANDKLSHGSFADIDQEWLEQQRSEGLAPVDVIRELEAQHGGGI